MLFVIINIIWRLALFVPLLLLASFRIVNLTTLLVGAIFIFFDPKKYGRILGWLLAIASLAATVILYIIYSVEGGLMY